VAREWPDWRESGAIQFSFHLDRHISLERLLRSPPLAQQARSMWSRKGNGRGPITLGLGDAWFVR